MKDADEYTTTPVTRASDAERDRVVAQLQDHYAIGRLTLPELEERVARAYQARTREQLLALSADLPDESSKPAQVTSATDPQVLLVLLCCCPPAALVYWLVTRSPMRRQGAPPQGPTAARDVVNSDER
jgi:hypothetical protein